MFYLCWEEYIFCCCEWNVPYICVRFIWCVVGQVWCFLVDFLSLWSVCIWTWISIFKFSYYCTDDYFYFMYLGASMLYVYYMYMYNCYILLMYWPLYYNDLFFSSVSDLKPILSDRSVATPALLLLPFAWNIFFCPFTFRLCVFLKGKWVSCRQDIVESCFFIHSHFVFWLENLIHLR